MVSSLNNGSCESPNSNVQWFGFNLPEDTDYVVMDILAMPKNTSLNFEQQGRINNTRKSRETFDHKIIEMKNCAIFIFIRTTNHNLANLPNNIVLQQSMGKTPIISRVENKKILALVGNMEAGKIK